MVQLEGYEDVLIMVRNAVSVAFSVWFSSPNASCEEPGQTNCGLVYCQNLVLSVQFAKLVVPFHLDEVNPYDAASVTHLSVELQGTLYNVYCRKQPCVLW